MFYQIKRMVVKEGTSDKVLERFKGEGKLEKQPGFINLTALFKKVLRGDGEVLIMAQWESEADWKKRERSPDHIAVHKARLRKPKPDHIIEFSQYLYEVKVQN